MGCVLSILFLSKVSLRHAPSQRLRLFNLRNLCFILLPRFPGLTDIILRPGSRVGRVRSREYQRCSREALDAADRFQP
jgi:hypothetical protein